MCVSFACDTFLDVSDRLFELNFKLTFLPVIHSRLGLRCILSQRKRKKVRQHLSPTVHFIDEIIVIYESGVLIRFVYSMRILRKKIVVDLYIDIVPTLCFTDHYLFLSCFVDEFLKKIVFVSIIVYM